MAVAVPWTPRDDAMEGETAPRESSPASPREESPSSSPAVPERSKRRGWLRAVGVMALCVAAAGIGVMVGARNQGYAKQSDVEARTGKIETDLARVRADQRRVEGKVDLMAEVAAQFPQTADRIEALSEGARSQQKDAAEAQVATQKLTREVALLRETPRKSQRDSDRRLGEMHEQIEDRLWSPMLAKSLHVAAHPGGPGSLGGESLQR